MGDRLIEIECRNWTKLKDLYSPESPKTVLGLTTIENYIRWIEKDSNIKNLKFYSLNGDWSDGTFVVVDRYHVFIDSLNDSNERLAKLLNLLDYSKGFRFMHIRSRHYPIVKELIQQKQLELEYDDPNLLYYMPKEVAASVNVEIPQNYYQRSIEMMDVKKTNELWPFNHPGSLYFLQRLAQFNPSSAIFTKSNDELVSYIFQVQTGPLGMLYTRPEHRNQHLGTAATANLCKQIGETGFGVTACVKEKNAASRAIFERLGFQVIDKVHWMATICEWDEEGLIL